MVDKTDDYHKFYKGYEIHKDRVYSFWTIMKGGKPYPGQFTNLRKAEQEIDQYGNEKKPKVEKRED